MALEVLMSKSKSKKPPVQSVGARERSVQKLAAMVEREVQRRLGPNSTFEQRNNMAAEIMRLVASAQRDRTPSLVSPAKHSSSIQRDSCSEAAFKPAE